MRDHRSRTLAFLAALVVSLSACEPGAAPSPNPTTWTFIGPTATPWRPMDEYTETSGRVRDIVVDPAGVIYIAAAGGGVWKRMPFTTTWTPLTDFAPTLQARAIAIDPSDARTIYVGTGSWENDSDYHGLGILKSTDAGATWTHIVGPFADIIMNRQNAFLGHSDGGARIPVIAVSPTDRNVVLASVGVAGSSVSTSGVYRSSDGGLNWAPAQLGNWVTSIVFDSSDGNVAYAAFGSTLLTGPTTGVYKSTDAGRTWRPQMGSGATSIPAVNFGLSSLAISASRPGVLYIGVGDRSRLGYLLGMYKTTDGGSTWTQLASAPDYCEPQCYIWNRVDVHPSNPDVVFLGGSLRPVHVTLDGGSRWAEIRGTLPNALHPDVWDFAFSTDGNTVYVGSDGGIVYSSNFRDTTPTWLAMNDNLGITVFYHGFDVAATRRDFAAACAQDTGCHNFIGSLVWRFIPFSEGPNIAYDAGANRFYRFGATSAWNSRGWYDLTITATGLSWTERRQSLGGPIAINRSDPAIQYVATNRVYQTLDAGAMWNPISPVLPGDGFSYVTTIAIAAHAPNQVCAGTSDGRVWCSRDANRGASSTWTDHSTGLPRRYVMQVAIHKLKEQMIAAAFSGYRGVSGDVGGHVYLSSEFGAAWRDVTGNLPNEPVNGIAFDEDDLDEPIYAATDAGVFRTRDRATWAHVATGLPNGVAVGVQLHAESRTLYVPLAGRSMWRLSVPRLTAAPGPTIALNPWRMRFTAPAGGPNPPAQALSVMNAGSPTHGSTMLGWSATASTAFGGAWLAATPASGTNAATVSVSVDVAGLAAGRYNGIVRVAAAGATNGPEDVLVLLEVTSAGGRAAPMRR